MTSADTEHTPSHPCRRIESSISWNFMSERKLTLPSRSRKLPPLSPPVSIGLQFHLRLSFRPLTSRQVETFSLQRKQAKPFSFQRESHRPPAGVGAAEAAGGRHRGQCRAAPRRSTAARPQSSRPSRPPQPSTIRRPCRTEENLACSLGGHRNWHQERLKIRT